MAQGVRREPPIVVTNIYSTALIRSNLTVHLGKLLFGGLRFEMQGTREKMKYVLAALREILVSDYACPCEFKFESIDFARNTYLNRSVFEYDEEMVVVMPEVVSAFKPIIATDMGVKRIINDIVETYKIRCDPDSSVSLFLMEWDICVGFRAMNNG